MSIAVAVTRFDNKTEKENMIWRKKNNYNGCIYGVSQKISSNIKEGIYVIIFEMNITTNNIIGIGLIKNEVMKRKKIYSNGNYNRFVYKGSIRLDKQQLINNSGLNISQLELPLFYGNAHFKRGTGITIINKAMIKHIENLKLTNNSNSNDLMVEITKIKFLNSKEFNRDEINLNEKLNSKSINQILYSKDVINIKIQTKNPKRKDSESFKRYEKYKTATTLPMILSLGGTKLDIMYDINKGYVTFNKNYILNRQCPS